MSSTNHGDTGSVFKGPKASNTQKITQPIISSCPPDIFGIPGMLAEVERFFSSTKLIIPPYRSLLKPPAIEAGECIRSWVRGGPFYGDYFDYLSPEEQKTKNNKVQALALFGSVIFRNILFRRTSRPGTT
jgi:hAT family C-terminal dimerisation region